MNNINQEQRTRSKSKKKGILVSLTPSKIQQHREYSLDEFSQSKSSVKGISQLPVIMYQRSASRDKPNVNFIYQTPTQNSFVNLTPRSNKSEWVLANGFHKQLNTNQKQFEAIQITKMPFSQPKTQFIKKEEEINNSVKILEIRPAIFTIVEQIKQKVRLSPPKSPPISPPKQKAKTVKIAESIQNQALRQKSPSNRKNSEKSKVKNARIQQVLEWIPQKTQEVSQQFKQKQSLEKYQKKSEQLSIISKVQSPVKANVLNSIQNTSGQFSQSKRVNFQRLKLAQEKLLNIIKVCDYGL